MIEEYRQVDGPIDTKAVRGAPNCFASGHEDPSSLTRINWDDLLEGVADRQEPLVCSLHALRIGTIGEGSRILLQRRQALTDLPVRRFPPIDIKRALGVEHQEPISLCIDPDARALKPSSLLFPKPFKPIEDRLGSRVGGAPIERPPSWLEREPARPAPLRRTDRPFIADPGFIYCFEGVNYDAEAAELMTALQGSIEGWTWRLVG